MEAVPSRSSYVKNLYFNQKKQLLRKVSELYFVHDIESMLEKMKYWSCT